MRDIMENREAIEMMTRVIAEMQGMRSEIARLRPKAEAYDNISILLGLFPKPSQGYGEDLVWVLQKRIKELEANKVEPNAQPL